MSSPLKPGNQRVARLAKLYATKIDLTVNHKAVAAFNKAKRPK